MYGFGAGFGRGFGRGAGFGRGFGYGCGYGRRFWNDFSEYPISFQDEKERLARYLDRLELHQKEIQAEMEFVKNRISELEK